MIIIRAILSLSILIILICILFLSTFKYNKIRLNYKKMDDLVSKNIIFIKLNRYLLSLNIKFNKLSPYLFIIFSFIFANIVYFVSYKIFSVFSTAILISIISLFIPYDLVKKFYYLKKEKILKTLPTYIITLKTYIEVTNDIIAAFRNAKAIGPLKSYIDRFNLCVERGINVYDAFELLKQEIDIKQVNSFISSLQICYINGGNFSILLQRYANLLSKENIQREKEDQENFSSILVLIVLVIINIILLFAFIFANVEYKTIITKTVMGKVILNVNLLSYVFIYWIIKKVNKKGV